MYVLISLSLTFGGFNGPAEWSTIDKPIADLRNALLLDDKTQLPNQDLVPLPSAQDIYIQFAQSKTLAVNIPVYTQEKVDIYLDN